MLACSTGEGTGSDDSFQTEDELAKSALQILGAERIEGSRQTCNGCHDINRKSLRVWETQYKAALANLADTTKTAKQKVDAFRVEPGNPQAPYSPSRLGFLAATVHLADSPDGKRIADLFTEAFGPRAAEELKKFKRSTSMPFGSPDEEKLNAADFKIVKEWVDKGLPKVDVLLAETPRPGACEPMISDELKAHVNGMKTRGWSARNKDQQMPMFACTVPNDAKSCFVQKKDDGTDVFPEAETLAFGKTWKAAGSRLRLLHELGHGSSFWSRNSADGRFVSSGGGELGAFVVDFAKQLETKGKEKREIGVSALYDPSFMPDNSGLLIQGTGGFNEEEGKGGDGTHFCTQDLFTNASTKEVSFEESQCSALDSVGLYQTVGRRLADNELSDYFIINNSFESDDGFGEDPVPTFGMDQRLDIKVMVSLGSGQGYKIGQRAKVDAPWEGDTMMSPSTALTASRVSGENGQEGYSIRRLVSTMTPAGYTFEAKQVARICIPGGKANFSFDERYLVTHHYLTRADFDSDAAYEPFKNNPASDIYVVDLLTGEKIRVTRMAPGQLALFPHFRSDGWLYITVRDRNDEREYYVASDVVVGRP